MVSRRSHMLASTDLEIILDLILKMNDVTVIGLFKMFLRWILHIFTAQIQSQ